MTKVNEGVLLITSHLIITLVILVIYGYTLFTGVGDETLKTILTVIVGYWFGNLSLPSGKSKKEGKE